MKDTVREVGKEEKLMNVKLNSVLLCTLIKFRINSECIQSSHI